MVLEPGTVYLARTEENIEVHDLVPFLEGRSSVGRLGLHVHITAGLGQVGSKGYWTLELQADTTTEEFILTLKSVKFIFQRSRAISTNTPVNTSITTTSKPASSFASLNDSRYKD